MRSVISDATVLTSPTFSPIVSVCASCLCTASAVSVAPMVTCPIASLVVSDADCSCSTFAWISLIPRLITSAFRETSPRTFSVSPCASFTCCSFSCCSSRKSPLRYRNTRRTKVPPESGSRRNSYPETESAGCRSKNHNQKVLYHNPILTLRGIRLIIVYGNHSNHRKYIQNSMLFVVVKQNDRVHHSESLRHQMLDRRTFLVPAPEKAPSEAVPSPAQQPAESTAVPCCPPEAVR